MSMRNRDHLFGVGRWMRPCAAALALVIFSPAATSVNEITLTVDDIVSPAASLKQVSLRLLPSGGAEVTVGELKLLDRSLKKLAVTCAALDFSDGRIRCPRGRLVSGETVSDLGFTYVLAAERLELTIKPSPQEKWRLTATLGANRWQTDLDVTAGQMTRFGLWIPEAYPRPSKGTVTGRVSMIGDGRGIAGVDGNLRLADIAFSDQAGLHAAEKLAGSVALVVNRMGKDFRWRADVAWDSGEAFWAPLYFPSGGHRVEARGTLAGDLLRIDDGAVRLMGVGDTRFSLDWNTKSGLSTMTLDAAGLDGGGLYTLLLKPFLEKTALDQLTVSGKLDAAVRYSGNALREVNVALGELNVADARNRFSLEKLSATVPWQLDRETRASIRLGGAKLFGVPIGAFEVPARMRGFDFAVAQVTVPVLDGQLLINGLQAARAKEDWRWQFSGVLLPVSMESLTRALDLPLMRGALSATIPTVAYDQGRVNIEGGIGIRVFDGDVAITELSLSEPFSRAPRLYAEMEMRNLDLGLLTSTFKFGSMEGRIDADVKGLQLSNWKPVQFDARVASSPGNYRKKISQQAVQNISALGGAGAAAAIQRSFLRFFEEFGYDRIGLSCRLRNNVCEMSGVESTPQGYVIVKGGGIPAITVTGYNRYVGWNELLERLQRITQGNAQPVIK